MAVGKQVNINTDTTFDSDVTTRASVFEQNVNTAVPNESDFGVNMQLQTALQKDLVDARAAFARSQTERGVKDIGQKQRQDIKGYRVKGRVQAQDQFDKIAKARQIAINDFITTAGFTNEGEMQEARLQMDQKLKAVEKKFTQNYLAFKKMIVERQATAEQRRAAEQMMGKIIGMGIGSYFGQPMAGAQIGGTLT